MLFGTLRRFRVPYPDDWENVVLCPYHPSCWHNFGASGEFTQSKKPLLVIITSQGGNVVGRPRTVLLPILMTTQCLTQ